MKKVIRRIIIIILELTAVVIGAIVATFAMYTLGNGIQNFSFKIPDTEKETVIESKPSNEETEKDIVIMGQTEKQSETQETIIILEEPQSESQRQLQTQQTELQQQTESPIIIIDGDDSSENKDEEFIEFFTEQGTFFY